MKVAIDVKKLFSADENAVRFAGVIKRVHFLWLWEMI